MTKWIAFLALFLASCAHAPTPEPIIKTVEVVVPGPTQPCVPKSLGERPQYADTDEALKQAVDAAVRYSLLWAGRAERIAREHDLETVIDGCPHEK
jgi:hypothetical protein